MTPKILQLFKETPGAISVGEALAIEWLASQAPNTGVCLDVGTNAGKAAIAQSSGFRGSSYIHCIDPVFDPSNIEAWKDHTSASPKATGWDWIFEGDFKNQVINRIGTASRYHIVPLLYGESALTAIPRIGVDGVAFAFCDADNNQPWLVHAIVDVLEHRMLPGGIIAHHDFESQFIAPHEAQERLLATGNFERVLIPWDDIQKQVDDLGGEHEGNNSWHHKETERPMFVGAVRRL